MSSSNAFDLRLSLKLLRANKISNIFSILFISLAVAVLLAYVLGFAGLRDIVLKTFADPYEGVYFDGVYWSENNDRSGSSDNEFNPANRLDISSLIPSVDRFRSAFGEKYGITGIYVMSKVGNLNVQIKEIEGVTFQNSEKSTNFSYVSVENSDNQSNFNDSITITDPYLSKENVVKGYSLENKYGDKIPVLISMEKLVSVLVQEGILDSPPEEPNIHDISEKSPIPEFFLMNDRAVQYFKSLLDYERKLYDYVGKEVILVLQNDTQDSVSFKGVIVGFTTQLPDYSDSGRFGFWYKHLAIPSWAVTVNQDINNFIKRSYFSLITYIITFNHPSQRDSFAEDMVLKAEEDPYWWLRDDISTSSGGSRCEVSEASCNDYVISRSDITLEQIKQQLSFNIFSYSSKLSPIRESLLQFISGLINYLFWSFLPTIGFISGIFILLGLVVFVIRTRRNFMAKTNKNNLGLANYSLISIILNRFLVIMASGVVFGVVLAIMINIILSLVFGDLIYYSFLVAAVGTPDVPKPLFILIGLPI